MQVCGCGRVCVCRCVGVGVSVCAGVWVWTCVQVWACGRVCVCRCVGVSVQVCLCRCGYVCAGVWVCLHMCIVWGNSNHHYFHIILYIIIYSSNFLLFSLSLSLPSSILISCLLQLKSLHPFAFGDSASDHSKMQGFVRQLQEVETHSTEYVKSVTYIPSHTDMHWVRYVVRCHRRDHPGTSNEYT